VRPIERTLWTGWCGIALFTASAAAMTVSVIGDQASPPVFVWAAVVACPLLAVVYARAITRAWHEKCSTPVVAIDAPFQLTT
jgi:hypothetical protein